jgi:EAL domain-containing protein (putative c-di-GMP-specific phosphodiesterase class I)
MTGVEALLRWRHPTRGVIGPETFIPLIERNGLIDPIGRWVLDTACTQGLKWHRSGHPLTMSVNVSGRAFDDDRIVEDVRHALDRTGIEPAKLTLEITETALMRDAAAAAARLRQPKALGVRIAIDDFGSGYSSFAYLREFAVDEIKNDRSFVAAIATSSQARALVHTLIQLAKALGLETLGEGVETESQLRALRRERCERGHGFFFARPLTAEAVEEFMIDATPAATSPPPACGPPDSVTAASRPAIRGRPTPARRYDPPDISQKTRRQACRQREQRSGRATAPPVPARSLPATRSAASTRSSRASRTARGPTRSS